MALRSGGNTYCGHRNPALGRDSSRTCRSKFRHNFSFYSLFLNFNFSSHLTAAHVCVKRQTTVRYSSKTQRKGSVCVLMNAVSFVWASSICWPRPRRERQIKQTAASHQRGLSAIMSLYDLSFMSTLSWLFC